MGQLPQLGNLSGLTSLAASGVFGLSLAGPQSVLGRGLAFLRADHTIAACAALGLACPTGTYMSQALTATSGPNCTTLKVCDVLLQYQSAAPTATTDRVCTALTADNSVDVTLAGLTLLTFFPLQPTFVSTLQPILNASIRILTVTDKTGGVIVEFSAVSSTTGLPLAPATVMALLSSYKVRRPCLEVVGNVVCCVKLCAMLCAMLCAVFSRPEQQHRIMLHRARYVHSGASNGRHCVQLQPQRPRDAHGRGGRLRGVQRLGELLSGDRRCVVVLHCDCCNQLCCCVVATGLPRVLCNQLCCCIALQSRSVIIYHYVAPSLSRVVLQCAEWQATRAPRPSTAPRSTRPPSAWMPSCRVPP